MNDETIEDKIRNATAYDILSDRTLKYKRNLYITSILALTVFFGEITNDDVTISGLKFTLPNAEMTISFGVVLILAYYLNSFLRFASGEYTLWQERIDSRSSHYLVNWSNPTISKKHPEYGLNSDKDEEKHFILSHKTHDDGFSGLMTDVKTSKTIHKEIMSRVSYYQIFEFGLAVGLGSVSFALLLGKVLAMFFCN